MKALFIGGTGNLSSAAVSIIAGNPNWELTILNRGNNNECIPKGIEVVLADINNESNVKSILNDRYFDVVVDFVCFTPQQMERDVRIFEGKTNQFIFVSSAVVYQTPPVNYIVSEGVALNNPYWQYAKDKLACEEVLNHALRHKGFPATIVRPSHTYSDTWLPFCLEGRKGSWTILQRMLKGKPIIIPGDGTSLWVVTSNLDFAKGFVGLMGNIHAIGESVHITSDDVLTWNQIHKIISDALGVPFLPCHIPSNILVESNPELEGLLIGSRSHSMIFDNTKIKRLVPGFFASIPFSLGVRRTVQNILNSPVLHTIDAQFDKWCDEMDIVMKQAHQNASLLYTRVTVK